MNSQMKKALWHVGTFIDRAHLPAVFVLLTTGPIWMPLYLFFAMLGIILSLQIWLKDCPLNPIVRWLKHHHQPSCAQPDGRSFTRGVYHTYGRLAAIPILILCIYLSVLIYQMQH